MKNQDAKSMRNRVNLKRQGGVAIVEFAGSVMVVVFIMLVVAELGRVFYSYNIVTQSVRSSARFMSQNSKTPAGAFDLSISSAAARNLAVTGETNGGTPMLPGYGTDDITISAEYPSGATKPYVRVAAAYAYTPLFSALPNFWNGGSFDFSMTLNADNTMRSIK